MFDIFFQGDNPGIQEKFPFAKKVDHLDDAKPKTRMFWFIEPNVDVRDITALSWRPPEWDYKYQHVFKWDANNYGGIRLIPSNDFDAQTKEVNKILAVKRFDIIQSTKPGDYFDTHPWASHVWCVDPEYKLADHIDWAPGNFEPDYIHCFHLRGQLEHKYPQAEGGVKLFPRNYKKASMKFHGNLDASPDWPVIYVQDVTDYSERDRFDDEYVWMIDRDLEINEDTLDWAPNPFEDKFIHVFRTHSQLTERYPEGMGGIRLVPKDWREAFEKKFQGAVVHRSCPIEDVQYDVFFADSEDFGAELYESLADRSKTEWFWVVDRDYDFNGKLFYVPNQHEQEYIHVFTIPGHLEYRYNMDLVSDPGDVRAGGIRLVNKNFDIAKHKLHPGTIPVRYDIFYTNNIKNTEIYARRSRTKMFWLIDEDYQIDVKDLVYVPHRDEQSYLLNFQIPGQLHHKYPDSEGGVYLVPKQAPDAQIKYKGNLTAKMKNFPVHKVDNFDKFRPVVEDCWLIDAEYQIDPERIQWVPSVFERDYIHVFHLPGQLGHKYPEAMGGVRWVPASATEHTDIVIHEQTPFETSVEFEVFPDEQTGREKTRGAWFWVIDPGVDVLPDFDMGFIPEVWDAGKTHVWQKLNPKTGRQYDYGGVKLCPRVEKSHGRPKYIREPACVQKEFPVLELKLSEPVIDQLEKFDSQVDTSMYWVVDPHQQVYDDFDFEYYPTQWDQDCVHVFQQRSGTPGGVRLYPCGTFQGDHGIDLDQIHNNSFEKLKIMANEISSHPVWPCVQLQEHTSDEVKRILKEHAEWAYVFTLDSDQTVLPGVVEAGFLPEIKNLDRVHAWQRINPATGKTHSYGGLRLWPTDFDKAQITTEAVKLNKIRKLQYVRTPGSEYQPLDIVFLSYKEPGAKKSYQKLKKRFPNIKWVKDVKGIFEAHQEAAKQATSAMFWVVDADADIVSDFDFSYIPDVYDQEVVHVWNSKNPVTGDEYGYGGVKLFNRKQVLEATTWGLDFTTGLSNRFRAMPEISCVTKFNTSEFATWRSAFRECVKLAVKADAESQKRLASWLTPQPDAKYAQWAALGAEQGKEYALKYADDARKLALINDYQWLKEKFSEND